MTNRIRRVHWARLGCVLFAGLWLFGSTPERPPAPAAERPPAPAVEPEPAEYELRVVSVQEITGLARSLKDPIYASYAETLQELIIEGTGGVDAWEEPASIEVHRGLLIVHHKPAVHDAIETLLDLLIVLVDR